MGTTKKYKPETVKAAFADITVGEETPEGEIRVFCPVCENPETSTSPSASMNPEEGVWNCLKNPHGGKIWDLVKQLKEERGFDIRAARLKNQHKDPAYSAATQERLNGGRRGNGAPLPTQDQIDNWVQALLSNTTKLNAFMEQRGIERHTIIDWELGWDGQRYTIPVRGDEGEIVNVRRYAMGGNATNKMLNLPGHGSAHIFAQSKLRDNEEIVITEGETDCILLNQYGIPAITHTAGAGTFRPAWGKEFAGKVVWIVYDNDDAGRKGATKVQAILKPFAVDVYIIELPMDKKGADVTDYLHLEGHSERDFRELMGDAMDRGGVRRPDAPMATSGQHTSLNASMAQENQQKVLELVVSVAGRQQEPYTAPQRFTATCDQSKGPVCERCPIAAANGQAEIEVRADDENLFRFVDVPEQRRKQLMKEISGARCSDRVEFDTDENFHIEELLVQPSVDDRTDDETQQPVRRTAFAIGTHSTSVNRKVRLVGKNVADPKSGKLKFQAWQNEAVEMDIDKYELTPELRERLTTFQPSDQQTALDKCFEIAHDMAENVTHIYGRDELHVGYDLVWHSPIGFRVFDQAVEKGWLEMMVVGDTRTGKSEAATQLARHYRSGVMQSCEGMTFAGVVGGVQQIDGRWHMTWGVVPMNDRRLVVLDEASGLPDNVIEQMSSIRSSGVAQITKISSEETSARTRLVWITNPKDGTSLADSSTAGMGALRSVVPNNEDIARFDFVMAVAKGDVDTAVINSGFGERHAPAYSQEDSEALVKWAWSLTRDDVIITRRAAQAAVDAAMSMGEKYISDPPLIQSENVRFKILRVAAAIAARTFSVTGDGKLDVQSDHVRDAVTFLNTVYTSDAMGYARASRKALAGRQRAQEKKARVRDFLMEHQDDVLLTLRMVGGNTFRTRDFVEFGGLEAQESKAVANQLLKWNVAKLKSRGDMSMEPVLIEVLRDLEDDIED